MHFKGFGDSSSRPSTPADAKNGRHGRTLLKGTESPAMREASVDQDLTGRQPKRSNSFGLGLGGLHSLANGMSRAGETLTRKTTATSSDGTRTPPKTVAGAASTTNANGTMGPPTLPDSSHLAQFSLKLSELVNRAFMPCTGANIPTTPGGGGLAVAAKNAAAMSSVVSYQGIPALSTISYEGKKLPSKPVVVEIAKALVNELEYAASVDPYLLRAASRSSLKALTLFADRIDSLLISPSKDASVLFVPSTAKEGLHLPAGLEYNLGLVTLEWIVEDALERCIEGPPGTVDEGMPHFVSEILTPVRKKMEGTILHTIQPIISNVKSSLTMCLNKAVPMPFSGFGHALSPLSSLSFPESGPPTPSGLTSPHSPNASSWLRELEGRLEGCRRMLVPRIEERCGQDGEGWFISVAIHLIWKGLLILTSRTMPLPHAWLTKQPFHVLAHSGNQVFAAEASKRSPSPAQLTNALKSVSVKPRKVSGNETPSGVSTPSTNATAAVAYSARATNSQVQEIQAFEKLVVKFATGFEPSRTSTSSRQATENDAESSSSDDDDDDEDELARAALAEALQAIKSTILIVQYLDLSPEAVLEAILPHKDRLQSSTLPVEVIRAAKAIPHLLLLHLIYARMPTHLATFASVIAEGGQRTEPVVPSPPAVFAYTWHEYERAIAGFAGGQSWAIALVDAWKEDLEEANQALDAREEKMMASNISDSKESLEGENIDPCESTPTPESVLLRRVVSTRSISDSSDSIPEEMTASAPTLDREKEVAKATSKVLKSSAWASLKQSRRGMSSSRNGEAAASDTTTSPETSPPRSPQTHAANSSTNTKVIPTEVSKSKTRFWRSQSSYGSTINGGFHLSSAGRSTARGLSPGNASPNLTEEERLKEEIRLERQSVRLLKKTIDVIDASRKPKGMMILDVAAGQSAISA